MDPLLADVARHEVIVGVLVVGLLAYLAEVPLQDQKIALLADSLDPLVPEPLVLVSNVAQVLSAGEAVDAVLAKPVVLGDRGERRLQAVDVERLVAHVADNYLLLLVIQETALARLAVGTLPGKALD